MEGRRLPTPLRARSPGSPRAPPGGTPSPEAWRSTLKGILFLILGSLPAGHLMEVCFACQSAINAILVAPEINKTLMYCTAGGRYAPSFSVMICS